MKITSNKKAAFKSGFFSYSDLKILKTRIDHGM